ncbi:armadillo-type protein [Syncephalastrum racemosum]|uniref:Armadillo-type protein n=1 Tax=Syncephalastrum racemosum TaxID=13706 RepID=A0A1X2HDN6_SYNRA|nr:armadillo-type protein [Syncephalastrum racemosum]
MKEMQDVVNRLSTYDNEKLAAHLDLIRLTFQQLSDSTELDAAAWQSATQLAEISANAARTESMRTPLGDVIAPLAHLLSLSTDDQTAFRIQALRVLGNICFDHAENRKRVHEVNIIPTVVPYLQQHQDPTLIRTACGFCQNSTVEYAPLQEQLGNSDGLTFLLQLLDPARMDHGEEITVMMATKALENLVEEDSTRAKLSTSDTIGRLVQMIKYSWQVDQLENTDLLGSWTDILLQILAENDDMQNALLNSGYFSLLLDFMENAELTPENSEDKEEKERFDEVKNSFSKIIVYAASSGKQLCIVSVPFLETHSQIDEKLEELYKNEEVLSKFIEWSASDQDNLVQTAAYALGNLARTDEHCIELVNKYHLQEKLLEKYKSTEHATIQYAILGCLKHLCMPRQTKATLGAVIPVVSPMLESSKDMLKRNQFLTIGIIKLLCANEYDNARRVAEEPVVGNDTCLDLVLHFLKRVDDVAAKSEAARVLANVVKSVWLQNAEQSTVLRERLMTREVVESIAELTRSSKFVVLKNDGIIALSVLFADGGKLPKEVFTAVTQDAPRVEPSDEEQEAEEGNKVEVETRSFLQVLVDIACSDNNGLPDELRCNALVLTDKLSAAAAAQGTLPSPGASIFCSYVIGRSRCI